MTPFKVRCIDAENCSKIKYGVIYTIYNVMFDLRGTQKGRNRFSFETKLTKNINWYYVKEVNFWYSGHRFKRLIPDLNNNINIL